MKGRTVALVLAVLAVAWTSGVSLGADFPTKPVEILVPYTPGSSFDLMARVVGDIAPKYLGQPVAIVNKPGAGGSVAAAEVINAKPDGYKLTTLANIFFITTTRMQKVPFNPNMVEPLVNFMELKTGLVVRGDSPYKTFNDLVEYARKNPGKLKWNHPGHGISMHVNALMAFRKAGVKTVDIPYKAYAEIVSALLGGHVEASTLPYGAVKDLVKSGKLRMLMVFNDKRYHEPADVPCSSELGFPDASKMPTLVGLYAHKDTPPEIKAKLVQVFTKVTDDPEYRKGVEKIGEDVKPGGAAYIMDTIVKGSEVAVPILKEMGLYVGR